MIEINIFVLGLVVLGSVCTGVFINGIWKSENSR